MASFLFARGMIAGAKYGCGSIIAGTAQKNKGFRPCLLLYAVIT
jgi:hypothetical protein